MPYPRLSVKPVLSVFALPALIVITNRPQKRLTHKICRDRVPPGEPLQRNRIPGSPHGRHDAATRRLERQDGIVVAMRDEDFGLPRW